MARSGILVKTDLDGDVRRACVSDSSSLADFKTFVGSLYQLSSPAAVSLKWRDEDNDLISIVEERDWQCAIAENRGQYMRVLVGSPKQQQQQQQQRRTLVNLPAVCQSLGNEFAARVLQSAFSPASPVTATPAASANVQAGERTDALSNDDVVTSTAINSPVAVTSISNCPITQNIFHVQVIDPTSVVNAASVGNGNGNGSGNSLNADSFNGNLDGNGNLNGWKNLTSVWDQSTSSTSTASATAPAPSRQHSAQLRQLEQLGFTNTAENIRLLNKFQNNYYAVIDHLLANK